jgi:Leucine-rich repeat (LRR) protein
LVNLQYLNINNNLISDISALAGLTNLQYLNLHQNQISDISPLSSLTGLQELWILFNGISDISALAGLTNLTTLDLCHNFISDLSPLAGHRKLHWLRIHQASETSADCPLNEEAYCTYLVQIAANNPGIELIYKDNPNPPRGVAASDGTYPDKVHVTWDALCPGPIAEEEEPHTFYYKVYRSDSPSGSKQIISD